MLIEHLANAPMRLRPVAAQVGVAAAAVLLLGGATVAAQASAPAFVAFAAALVILAAVAAVRWPRTAIVLVLLSPIVDRYLVADLLPLQIGSASHYLSEALLLTVSLVVTWRAWADGQMVAAFRHPVTVALVAFTALSALSAVVNGVPIHVAVIGLLFTLDALALFFLPRLVGFTMRQALSVVGVVGGIVFVAAVLAIGQALLMPRLFGMIPVRGRFGEEGRLASLFSDPNVFGAFLVSAVPFALIAAARLPDRRLRWLAGGIAFVLLLALWLSFSRGAWIALVLGVGTMLAIVDRRALLIGAVAGALSFGTAVYMPRNLLVPGQPRPNILGSTVDRVGAIGVGGDLRTLFVIQSMPVLRDHALLGVGPGRFGGTVADTFSTPVYDEYGFDRLFWTPVQRTVDNFWLHLLIEAGILGTVAFLAALIIPGMRIVRAARRAVGWRRIALGGIATATVAIAVNSGTTMLLEANSIAFLFWLLLGLGTLLVATPTRPGVEDARSTGGVTPARTP